MAQSHDIADFMLIILPPVPADTSISNTEPLFTTGRHHHIALRYCRAIKQGPPHISDAPNTDILRSHH